jgi:biotin carboxyl carrier protein
MRCSCDALVAASVMTTMFACVPTSDDTAPVPQDSAGPEPRPLFQLPFPCGQQWLAQTYTGHKPNTNSIDLTKIGGASSGQSIVAALAGQVVRARFESGGGNFVRIDHGNGWQTRYLHMIALPVVSEGQHVSQGQLLGHVGSTGDSGAPHLHFEEIQDGTTVRSALDGQLVTVDVGRSQILTSFNCDGGDGIRLP